MSWLFSQALVAASSGERSSGGEPSAPSSLTPTPAMCFLPGRTTDVFRPSRSGMTCEPLTADRGAELLMWCLAASRARTSALPAVGPELEGSNPVCGGKWPASLAKYDRASRSWRTAQLSLFGGLGECLETWPTWGWLLNGESWGHDMPEPDISEPESGWWPTPNKMDGAKVRLAQSPEHWLKESARHADKGQHKQYSLSVAVHFGCGESKYRERIARLGVPRPSPDEQLHPEWVEWLMGWPLGWTDCNASATDRFRQWLDSHGRR